MVDILITEIEVSRVLLKKIFTRFLDRITPRKEEVNDMNYFPVRDCDTGDNLVLTLKSIMRGINRTDHCPKRELIEVLQEEILLDSARGNAGMIFTGWFTGFLNYLSDELLLNSENLAQAMDRGREWGNKVFSNPREGTILDPLNVSAHTALECWVKEKNLVAMLDTVIKESQTAVANTTNKLNELLEDKNTPEEIHDLQEKHVVDAGALGFLIFLESLKESITEMIEERGGVVTVIEGEVDFDEQTLSEAFQPLGESLDIRISPSRKRVAVHIHTWCPRKVAEAARRYSDISEFRIEDLAEEG